MDMNIVFNQIKPEFIILVIALWCLGKFLKLIPTFKAEWVIPIILLGVGVLVTIVFEAFILREGINPITIVNGSIQGILVASVAVFGNEILKQINIKRLDDIRDEIRAKKPDKRV